MKETLKQEILPGYEDLAPKINFIQSKIGETKRVVNPGAEKWVGKPIEVLDKGYVYLVDYMGDDTAIEQAARTSYGQGTRTVNQTEGLIRYLRRGKHTTPFEMGEMKFHASMPIFVARQWVRHRTASINEYSARYSVVPDIFYVPKPENIAVQSTKNRQGRGARVSEEYAKMVIDRWKENGIRNYQDYLYLLNDDGEGNPTDPTRPQIAREVSRNMLPVDYYTEWYWKTDLHNLFHFLLLRKDPHAQWEIRQYADAMGKITEDSYPLSWKAFEDYELYAVDLSRPEQKVLALLVERSGFAFDKDQIQAASTYTGLTNKREKSEMIDKFGKLGLIKK